MTIATANLSEQARERLYPPRTYGRYYIARLLRESLDVIAQRHIGPMGRPALVDFGCGDMPYRPLIEPHVGSYFGVDLPGNPLADGDLSADGTVPVEDGSAGVVMSTQVLEHVDDPAGYLAECRRMLRPEGLLVLSTHGNWVYHPHPADWWRWTGSGLSRVLAQAGFEMIQLQGLMGLAAAGVQLLQDGLVRKLPKRMRALAVLPMQALAELADRLHSEDDRRLDACVYIAVARRCRLKPAPQPMIGRT
jgi:SAM-dependent methyltransferase